MPRTLWKGAISFGLVHIPVGLYPATHDESIDFDWLDKRTMDPVGYKRINKRTGREIDRDNIVKGVKVEGGNYVVLSDDEIRAAYPKTTKTIEIESFVEASDISFVFLDRPYYLLPQGNAGKVYALLRETLASAGRVGIARVVIQTKQHLAALMPVGPALMLHTLRWADEVRGIEDLDLPAEGKKATGLNAGELRMAKLLVDDMAHDWDPDAYSDRFREAVMALVEKKRKAGNVEMVEPLEEEVDEESSNVIDLTALLKSSLNRGKGGGKGNGRAARDDDEDDDEPRSGSVTPFKLPGKGGKGAAAKGGSTRTGARAQAGDDKAPAKKTAARKTASKTASKRASAGKSAAAKKAPAKRATKSAAKSAAKSTQRRRAA